jgi:hypothetical protein
MDQSATLYNWPTTYKPEAWRLPAYKKADPNAGEFRNLFINWQEFMKTIPAGMKPPMWALYCDVLRLEKDVSLDLTTIIFARRIEVSGRLSIIIDRTGGQPVDLILYAQEVVNYNTGKPEALSIVDINADEQQASAELKSAGAGAAGIVWMAGKQPVTGESAELPPDKDFLIEGEPLRLLLTTTFQVATLLCTSMPDLSLAQLHWIEALAAANPDTLDLSLQAGAMASNLVLQQQAGSNAVLVPFLDSSVYAESAQNLMTLLQHRDGKWTALLNLKRSDEQWKEIIEDSIGDKSDQAGLARQLEKQAEDSLVQAWQARSIAARLIVEQKSSLQGCKNDFDVGVKHWAEEQSLKEGFNIVMGIINILKEIPAIVAGGPAFIAVDILPAANGLIKGLAGVAVTLSNTISNAGGGNNNGAGGNAGGDNAGGGNLDGGDAGGDQPKAGDAGDLDGIVFKDDFLDNLGQEAPVKDGDAGGDGPKVDQPGDGGGQPVADQPKGGDKSANGLDKKAVKKLLEDEKKAQAERVKASEAFKKSLATAGSEAVNVVNAALRIVQIAGQAAAMEAAGARILASIGKTVDQSLSSADVKGLDVVTGGSQEWDILGLEIEQLFSRIKPLEEIKGGAAYRLEFRKLIVKGKALSEARLAVAKASFQLAEMKLRTLVAEKSLNRSKERMQKIAAQILTDDSLQQYAFNKLLDAKRSVYMALESYRRAFMYFTLADNAQTPRLPSLLDSVDEFQKTVSNIAGRELTLSGAFKTSPPQTINKQISIDDPETIEKLRQSGYITWTLKYNDEHFKNLARIRFHQMSVFVEFEEGYRFDKEISVRIMTSGQYADKNLHKGEKLFVGPPLQKNFEYTEVDGVRDISVYANISARFVADFFNPTPFTTWTFSFNDAEFDRKQIKSLKLAFAGDALSL